MRGWGFSVMPEEVFGVIGALNGLFAANKGQIRSDKTNRAPLFSGGERREARGERREAKGGRREAKGERRKAGGERENGGTGERENGGREEKGERSEAGGERGNFITVFLAELFFQQTGHPNVYCLLRRELLSSSRKKRWPGSQRRQYRV